MAAAAGAVEGAAAAEEVKVNSGWVDTRLLRRRHCQGRRRGGSCRGSNRARLRRRTQLCGRAAASALRRHLGTGLVKEEQHNRLAGWRPGCCGGRGGGGGWGGQREGGFKVERAIPGRPERGSGGGYLMTVPMNTRNEFLLLFCKNQRQETTTMAAYPLCRRRRRRRRRRRQRVMKPGLYLPTYSVC